MNKNLFLFQLFIGHLVLSQTTFYSTITVYVLPTASSSIHVSCWSNSSSSSSYKASQNFTSTGEFSWTISSTSSYSRYYDPYWCRARMGSDILPRFPVYGDGVEKNSSEWIINSRGKRRFSLENELTEDRRTNWTPT